MFENFGTEEEREEHLTAAMAYQAGHLDGEVKADFERHLATCELCQWALKKAETALPMVNKLLAGPPPKDAAFVDAQVEQFKVLVAREQAARATRRRALGFAAIGVAAAVLLGLGLRNSEQMPKPHDQIAQQVVDAGAGEALSGPRMATPETVASDKRSSAPKAIDDGGR